MEDIDFDIYLKGDKIILDDKECSLKDLKENIIKLFKEDLIDEIEYYLDLYEKEVKGSDKKLLDYLKVFDQKDIYKFLDYLDNL